MAEALQSTDLTFSVPSEQYRGKVRDTYNLANSVLVLVATDRISAFDVILPRAIPYKGQVLNQTALHFLEATQDIVRNHLIISPDPNVTIGHYCTPIPIEMVVRGHLCGHAWRIYRDGGREICGVTMPEGLRENDAFPEPIITPATKSAIGHDEDISEQDILKSGLVENDVWAEMRYYTLELFRRGQAMAREKGLILADTKYEFGYDQDDRVTLIDEIHTPDSSRYFYTQGFDARQVAGEPQKQLSKEFVREWLMENGFQGLEGQVMPTMPDAFVASVSARYIELYETVTGQPFIPAATEDLPGRIQANVTAAITAMGG
ncbi:MAG: phosphoribosylaminoimidazolesuccinocarboxamide synthase [Bacteroidota bacterium]